MVSYYGHLGMSCLKFFFDPFFILMDDPKHIDTISMELFIVYLKGLSVTISIK